MLVPQHGSSLAWGSDHLPNYHNLSDNNVANELAAVGTDLDSLGSTVGDSIDTWSATDAPPIVHKQRSRGHEATAPDSGSITNDTAVGSTLDLAPPPVHHVSINYSTDSLTTYFTVMSYLMGTTE